MTWFAYHSGMLEHSHLDNNNNFETPHVRFTEGYYGLEDLGPLVHLRYLGIRDTRVGELPEEIGALKFLQLVCLRAWRVRAPDGIIGKLTSLEELQAFPHYNDRSKGLFVKDLGNLRELRVLRTCIEPMDESMQQDLVQSLGILNEIQHLTLKGFYTVMIPDSTNKAWDAVVLSRHLRHLLLGINFIDSLPSCIDPSRLPSLTHLQINVHDMDEHALKSLGGLPELRYLKLCTVSTARLDIPAADGGFPKLRSLLLPESTVHFVRNEGSRVSLTIWNGYDDGMASCSRTNKEEERITAPTVIPNLQELQFKVDVRKLLKTNASCDNLGLEHLPSLRKVIADFYCRDAFAVEVEKEEAALRHTICRTETGYQRGGEWEPLKILR
ncbi:unnamed protein product [Urochloa decumbens]|uniref:Disease resistance R13L4/SHOC-2-like LRR domain-containing protein n=1 Tax=Urochloa decumbens TaxID=240449 RepID=A0ABC9B1G2_9POAL